MLGSLKPDILLLDLRMPVKNGLAVLEMVNFDTVPTRVIVLTAAEDERDVDRAMRLGARGAVLTQSAAGVLLKCIQRVHAGEIWLDNRITAEVIGAFSRSDSDPRRGKAVVSDREKEIVRLVTQGLRNKEIGVRLFISEQTVKNHLHNIFDKLASAIASNWRFMPPITAYSPNRSCSDSFPEKARAVPFPGGSLSTVQAWCAWKLKVTETSGRFTRGETLNFRAQSASTVGSSR